MEIVQGDKWMTPRQRFFSLGDANRYYAARGIDSHDVAFMLATGEIELSDDGIKYGSPSDP